MTEIYRQFLIDKEGDEDSKDNKAEREVKFKWLGELSEEQLTTQVGFCSKARDLIESKLRSVE